MWACGIEARNQLRNVHRKRKRDVQCESKRFDLAYRNRALGNCKVDGEELSLNQWLVRQGWAISFEPYARSRFKSEQEEARTQHKGLWRAASSLRMCLRDADTDSAMLLGSACPKDKQERSQDVLLLAILQCPRLLNKGQFCDTRSHHRASRHLSFGRLQKLRASQKLRTRWFCSEKEAEADGFGWPSRASQMLGVVETMSDKAM